MLFGKRLKKRAVSLIGLSILAIVIQFLDNQRPQPVDLFSDLPDQHLEPDYYTVKSFYKEFNTEGNLSRTLQSDRLVHYPESENTLMEQPLIITFNAQGSPLWQAKGDKGRLEGDGDHFLLTDNVMIWKTETLAAESATPSNDFKLKTESMSINLKDEYAHTKDPVELESNFGNTHAIGLEANLKTNQIKLLDQVRGTYAQ
ncbi:LPS export ABC transporter protein LptC [Oceanospirillum multiglobuliferum]|uniref:Lipopolysaccharide export system protein LptC n=1 Tax=Oceanospirillum multiglobuliferum TaxID=64969 RepID=A0A1T4KU67_9GAMM|nr:LPS export ABC transporter periplasmic protein LptC [Oceanospirillum multiglobuliferum]OPX54943.1 LPS export ABC transporter periplasmic protein LptC [Oceanospirillum multiglobuliferum]SJZ45913.1 LPS export ABC transporter protein LptC [Oceanospirillum multiglobuliferum]